MQTPRTTLIAMLLVAGTLPGLAMAQAADLPATTSDTYALATADRTAAGCPPLNFSNLQRRVLNEADRGGESLRRYVVRTRMLHQLDIHETSHWVDQVRQRNADCRTAITAMAP